MSIAGTWTLTLHAPTGAQELTFQAAVAGDLLTGTIASSAETIAITKGKVTGDDATWDLSVKKPMSLTVSFTGKVDGDKIAGNAKLGMFGNAKFEGTRA